jgi:hypothetical protein
MEEDQSKRLAAVVERRKAHAAGQADKERQTQNAAAERHRARAIAEQQWAISRGGLTKAIDAVNASIGEGDLKFIETSDDKVAPALARIHLSVDVRGQSQPSGPKIRINVTALGGVQVTLLLTGRVPGREKAVGAWEADQAFYTELLTSFLEECF